MDFLFSFFEFLTLGAGPFIVFAGMGTGTQSGKLKFKTISPANSSMSVTENSDHIVVSSNISSASAPANQVLWGTGTSFTSGFLKVDNTNKGIVNIKHIGEPSEVSSSYNDGSNSLLLKGRKSYIYNTTNNSNAISTCGTKLCYTTDSNIISSVDSAIDGYGYNAGLNTIIGSYTSDITGYSRSSTILSSGGKMCRQKLGSIISSSNSCNNTQYQSCGNSIISSWGAQILGCKTNFNSIISSIADNYISHNNPLANDANNNFIGASRGSAIKGGQVNPGITYGSKNSSILSSLESIICDGKFSSIIGSCGSKICFYRFYGSVVRNNDYNSIIGSRNSRISICVTGEYYSHYSCTNTIISSDDSKDYASCNTAIVSSIGSKIKRSSSSVIFSSCNSDVYDSCSSSIVSSAGSAISSSRSSAIVSGFQNQICSGSHYSVIINGCFNIISKESYRAVILSGACNIIGFKGSLCNPVIIAGCKNCIEAVGSENTSIIGGYNNCISGSSDHSQILGGTCNRSGASTNSVIIGGCKNYLINARYSVIIGGRSNVNSSYTAACNLISIANDYSNLTGSLKSVAIIGTSNLSTISLGYSYLTMVDNFIFDKCVIVQCDQISSFCGCTTTFNPSTTSFRIRKGFITG
jgi:hypothetical protein